MVVERHDAVDINVWHVEEFGDLKHGFAGKIAKFALNLLQNGDQI